MDVAALLRCWPIEVDLGGDTYVIPALPAAVWIEAMVTRDVLAIVPGLLGPEEEGRISDALVWGELDQEELITAVRDAVEAAAGRPWWEAYRLVLAAADQADVVFGHLAERGFDFERQSLGAFCAAVYAVTVRNMEKKDRMKFDMAVRQAPAEVLADDDDALSDAFMQAMREAGGSVPPAE